MTGSDLIDLFLVSLSTAVMVLLGYWALNTVGGWWRGWRWRRSLGNPRDAGPGRRRKS